MISKDRGEYSDEEIAKRRDAAIRRALNTPHRPTRELIGKTERAKAQREARALRACQPIGESGWGGKA